MMNHTAARLKSVRDQFSTWGVDAILIGSSSNRLWLSGFTGSSGRLLITDRQAILATDSRYWEQAAGETAGFELFRDQRQHEDTVALVTSVNAGRIGLEANHITLVQAAQLERIADISWVPLDEPIEPLRRVKTPSEIKTIRQAAAITDRAMSLVPRLVRVGISERELAWELEKTMRDNRADGLAFPIIVAFGPNSALPHHHPGSRRLNAEEVVLVDMGAEIDGYRSDLTRTFYYGRAEDQKFSAIYNLVLTALNNAINNIRPGMNSLEVYNLAMNVIADGGHRENFRHGLGHGIGLDIHERPFLSATGAIEEITSGMAITVEPGIYLPDWGGVRIEDLILVNETGNDPLSKCPKIPFIRI